MRRFILFALLLNYGIAVSLAEPSQADRDLMNQVATECLAIRPLEFPRPDVDYDRDAINFENSAKDLERTLDRLRKANASATESAVLVDGKPFCERVSATLKIIQENRERLAAEPSPEVRRLMRRFVMEAADLKGLKQLEFPRPETNYDSDVREFHEKAGRLERTLELLRKEDASAVDSTRLVYDKPFSEQVKATLETIQDTRTRLEADKAAKPNPEAMAHVDFAINVARSALRNTEGLEWEEWASSYDTYGKELKAAALIDPRALDKRRKELEETGGAFTKKYTEWKSARDQERAAVVAREEAANAAAAKRGEARWRKMKAEAESLGYKDAQEGIVAVLDQLQDGTTSLDEAKSTLIYHDPEDDFRVQSVVDRYAIYSCDLHSDQPAQIAVLREKGAFYGEGAELAVACYAVVATRQFATVLGAEKEVVVLKRVR